MLMDFYQSFSLDFARNSTTRQILRLLEWMTRAFNFKKVTGAVLMVRRLSTEYGIVAYHASYMLWRYRAAFKKFSNSYLTGRVFNVRVTLLCGRLATFRGEGGGAARLSSIIAAIRALYERHSSSSPQARACGRTWK
jgi:hypothetical protein